MAPISKIVEVMSCGFLLSLELSNAVLASNVIPAEDERQLANLKDKAAKLG
ncbi:MAG: hypothetical protein ACREJN_00330 [Nitrospiraceae bacterium]